MTLSPVFIPSKGRADSSLTAKLLQKAEVPFRLVIEAHELDAYRAHFDLDELLVMPTRDLGAATTRNWIKDFSRAEGHSHHWQLDDNIRGFKKRTGTRFARCSPREALEECELFSTRFSNVAISGLKHQAYPRPEPVMVNQQVYCCVLVKNDVPLRWRGVWEDTDYSLQVLAMGLCTLLFQVFVIEKAKSGSIAGGHTDLYKGDGRLKRLRWLERQWPGCFRIQRAYGEPRIRPVPGLYRSFPQRPVKHAGK